MTATLIETERTASPGPLLLPEQPRRFGPTSRRLLARLVVALAVVELVGTALIVLSDSETWRAFGVGLVFPGAGLLYDASPILFLLTQALVLIALVLWWGLSTHFSIPLVWLGTAIAAALLADGPRLWVDRGTTWSWAIPVAYVCALAVVATMVWKIERRFQKKRAMVPELNAYLAEAQIPERVTTLRPPDAMDAELLRWCYSFAEQPDDGLAGMDWGEQFHGGTQLRYQLNSISWAMSLYAANYLPNAPGRMTEALAKVVHKHTDLRVWEYWRTLNLLGNFDPNPDPIRRDNIMFSAFLGDVVNSFEAATGDLRFDEPASLTFVWKDGRTFEYDHHTLTAAVRKNFERSRLGFFPCEPGWSFTVCNVMGAQALHGHDTIHGSDDWAAVGERWAQTLDDEYLTPDGSYAHIRSNHIGVSWDTGEVPGRALPRQRHPPVRRHPPRARPAGAGARPAWRGAEDGDAVEHRRRRHARPRTAARTRAAPHVVELAAAVDQDHRWRTHGRRREADRRGDRRVGPAVRHRQAVARATGGGRRVRLRLVHAAALVGAARPRPARDPRLGRAGRPARRSRRRHPDHAGPQRRRRHPPTRPRTWCVRARHRCTRFGDAALHPPGAGHPPLARSCVGARHRRTT